MPLTYTKADAWVNWQVNNAYINTSNITTSGATYLQATWQAWNTTWSQTSYSANTNKVEWVWQTSQMSQLATWAYVSTVNAEAWWDHCNDDYFNHAEQRKLTEAEREERLRARFLADARTLATRAMPLTAEQREVLPEIEQREYDDLCQRRREEQLERERARARDEAAWAEAGRRAELLLMTVLSAEQKREWLEHRRITEVAASGRVYRLHEGWAGNLSVMDGEVRRLTLCVHPKERVPDCDNLVAQLLTIRNRETHLLQLAVKHTGTWTPEENEIRAGRTFAIVQERYEDGVINVPIDIGGDINIGDIVEDEIPEDGPPVCYRVEYEVAG